MAEKVGDAYVELGTRNAGLNKGLNRGLSSVTGFVRAASGLIVGSAMVRGASKFISASNEQEDAVEGLASALRSYGEDVNALLPDLAKYAAHIQKVTKFGDESNLMLMTTLRNLGVQGDALKQAAKDAIGLATALQMDANTAARYTALAKQGEFTILQRYVPALRQATTQAEKQTIVNELMARGFKQAQDAAQTTRGQLVQMKNNAGDLSESIGMLILRFASADGKVRSLSDGLGSLSDRLRQVSDAQIKTTKDITAFIVKFTAGLFLLSKAAPLLKGLQTLLLGVGSGFGSLGAISATAMAASATAIGFAIKAMIEWKHSINEVEESMNNLNATLADQEKNFGTKSTEALRRRRRRTQAQGLDTRTGKQDQTKQAGSASLFGQLTSEKKSDVLDVLNAIKSNDAERLRVLRAVIPETVSMVESKLGGISVSEKRNRNFGFTGMADAIRQIQVGVGQDKQEKELKIQTGVLKGARSDLGVLIETIKRMSPVGV